MILVNISNGNNAEVTIDQLQVMCAKDGVALDLQPSRRGDYFIVKFNNCAVGKLYHNAVDAALSI